jgi:hypothetical protein
MRAFGFWDIVRLSKWGTDMKQRVLILGHGKMGHAMECLISGRHDVRIWCMEEEGDATLEEMVAWAQVILFCLPVNPHHEVGRASLRGDLRPDDLGGNQNGSPCLCRCGVVRHRGFSGDF